MTSESVNLDTFTGLPVAVEFFFCPRLITPGRPYIGSRFVGANGACVCDTVVGVSYTHHSSVEDLLFSLSDLPGGPEVTAAYAVAQNALRILPRPTLTPQQKQVDDLASLMLAGIKTRDAKGEPHA